ncbi:MAG TPA: hypothetical protein VK176_14540 [Phycisphaerales bacterium]|nr:hypothetical protein [Phycisphaerales bacterium]
MHDDHGCSICLEFLIAKVVGVSVLSPVQAVVLTIQDRARLPVIHRLHGVDRPTASIPRGPPAAA